MNSKPSTSNSGIKKLIRKTSLYKFYADQRFAKREQEINDRKLPFIQQVLPKKGVGAELGVLKGFLSPILLEQTKAVKLHLIDPWYLLTPHWTWGGGNTSTVDAVINILKTFKTEIEEERVAVHVGDDCQILTTFPDQYFDWVYIDSSHEYDHTKNELKILPDKVKSSGMIAGDDWQLDGVRKAVEEFAAARDYNIIYADESDHQWAIKK